MLKVVLESLTGLTIRRGDGQRVPNVAMIKRVGEVECSGVVAVVLQFLLLFSSECRFFQAHISKI